MDNNINNFSQFVGGHEEGVLNSTLTNMMQEMVQELNNIVLDQGGTPSGEINLKVKFKYDSGMIEVRAVPTMKLPEPSAAKVSYWSTKGDLLTRQNPKQVDMFRDVKAAEPEIKTIAS